MRLRPALPVAALASVLLGAATAHAGIVVTTTHLPSGKPAVDVVSTFTLDNYPDDPESGLDLDAAYYTATVDRASVGCAARPEEQAASSRELTFNSDDTARFAPGRKLWGKRIRVCAWLVIPSTGEDPTCTPHAEVAGECVPIVEPDAIEKVARVVRVPKRRPAWPRRWKACGSPSNLVNGVRAFAFPCSAARRLAANVIFGRGPRVGPDNYGLPAFRCRTRVLGYEHSRTLCRSRHHRVRFDTTP